MLDLEVHWEETDFFLTEAPVHGHGTPSFACALLPGRPVALCGFQRVNLTHLSLTTLLHVLLFLMLLLVEFFILFLNCVLLVYKNTITFLYQASERSLCCY